LPPTVSRKFSRAVDQSPVSKQIWDGLKTKLIFILGETGLISSLCPSFLSIFLMRLDMDQVKRIVKMLAKEYSDKPLHVVICPLRYHNNELFDVEIKRGIGEKNRAGLRFLIREGRRSRQVCANMLATMSLSDYRRSIVKQIILG
jgi:hypothetical protein